MLINMLINKSKRERKETRIEYFCDRNKFLSMFSVPHKLSAALRANAQKKNCYGQSPTTFLRIVFYSSLRFIKNLYAIAPMMAMVAPLSRSPFGPRRAVRTR